MTQTTQTITGLIKHFYDLENVLSSIFKYWLSIEMCYFGRYSGFQSNIRVCSEIETNTEFTWFCRSILFDCQI